MSNKIIQGNIRDAKSNLRELILLIRICPPVICLQEIFRKENNEINIKKKLHNYTNRNTDRASGEILIIIDNKIYKNQNPLGMQAITVSATLDKINKHLFHL